MNHTEIQIEIDKRRMQGRNPINLATGGFLMPISPMTQSLLDDLKLRQVNYTSSLGDYVLRDKVASILNQTYHCQLQASNLGLVFGGTEGVYLTIAALSKIQHWLHFMPGWHTLSSILKMLNKSMVTHPLEALDLPRLKPNTGIFVNTPVNPTGFLMPLNFIHSLLENRDVPILFDMVYEGMVTSPKAAYFQEIIQKAIAQKSHCTVVFSLSKLFRVAGLRLGIIVGNKDLISAIGSLKSAISLNLPYDLQCLLVRLLSEKEKEMQDVSRYLHARENWLNAETERLGVQVEKSMATHYRLIDCGQEVDSIFNQLIENDIFVAKCSGNGLPSHIRFNLSADKNHILQLLTALAKKRETHHV